jgi:hypothetical protein
MDQIPLKIEVNDVPKQDQITPYRRRCCDISIGAPGVPAVYLISGRQVSFSQKTATLNVVNQPQVIEFIGAAGDQTGPLVMLITMDIWMPFSLLPMLVPMESELSMLFMETPIPKANRFRSPNC